MPSYDHYLHRRKIMGMRLSVPLAELLAESMCIAQLRGIPMHGVLRKQSSRVELIVTCLFVIAAVTPTVHSAVATRHYDFEEGVAGEPAAVAQDIVDSLLFEGRSFSTWTDGHLWIEVAGDEPRPLRGGNIVDAVESAALITPRLERSGQGSATYVDVSIGSAMDSPAILSRLALDFNGDAFYDDANSGPGSRGVYVESAAYENGDSVSDDNVIESRNLITQSWVRPSSTGMGTAQTVWQIGTEQGSVNITEDGFWEFRDLGSVGVISPNISVTFDSWTHLGVYRAGNGAEIYIDGLEVASDRSPENSLETFATLITLGGDADNSNGFIGLVDDFKVNGTPDVLVTARDMDFWAVTCDFDEDGNCDVSDLDELAFVGQATQALEPYDLNRDDAVDILDQYVWMDLASEQHGVELILGDADLDGMVAISDLNIVALNWTRTDAVSVTQADFNGDQTVNIADLSFVAQRWNTLAGADAFAVPESSSSWILLAMIALKFATHRQQSFDPLRQVH